METARQLMRDSILSSLRHLGAATNNSNAYVSIGCGVTMLHIRSTTATLYASRERLPIAAVAVALGTTFVVLRTVENVIALAGLSRVTIEVAIDPESCGRGSKVPIVAYLDAVERLGAKFANDTRRFRAT